MNRLAVDPLLDLRDGWTGSFAAGVHQRVHRPTRGRLRRHGPAHGRGVRRLPRAADRDLRRNTRRSGHRPDHDERGRGRGCHHRSSSGWDPTVISFTVETDGRLPCGTPPGDAIKGHPCGHRLVPRVPHGQLCPPGPPSRRVRRRGRLRTRRVRRFSRGGSASECRGRCRGSVAGRAPGQAGLAQVAGGGWCRLLTVRGPGR